MYKILVSSRLAIDADLVRVARNDTDMSSDGGGTFASRTAVLGGNAATLATDLRLAAVEASAIIIPFVTDLFEKVGGLAQSFSNLDPAQQKFILALAAVVAIGGPTLIFVGKLIQAYGLLKGAIEKAAEIAAAMNAT